MSSPTNPGSAHDQVYHEHLAHCYDRQRYDLLHGATGACHTSALPYLALLSGPLPLPSRAVSVPLPSTNLSIADGRALVDSRVYRVLRVLRQGHHPSVYLRLSPL